MIDVAGARTTAASKILRDNVADRDAASRRAPACAPGRSSLGKLNTHEFAFGALTTSPHFGPARNPWALDADLRRLERRQRRGGRGRPRRRDARHRHRRLDPHPGLLLRRHRAAAVDRASSRTTASCPVSWTFDTVGPIARSAEDCALLLSVIARTGRTTSPAASRGLRVGVVEALLRARRAGGRGARASRRSRSCARSVRGSSRSRCRCSRRPGRSSSS